VPSPALALAMVVGLVPSALAVAVPVRRARRLRRRGRCWRVGRRAHGPQLARNPGATDRRGGVRGRLRGGARRGDLHARARADGAEPGEDGAHHRDGALAAPGRAARADRDHARARRARGRRPLRGRLPRVRRSRRRRARGSAGSGRRAAARAGARAPTGRRAHRARARHVRRGARADRSERAPSRRGRSFRSRARAPRRADAERGTSGGVRSDDARQAHGDPTQRPAARAPRRAARCARVPAGVGGALYGRRLVGAPADLRRERESDRSDHCRRHSVDRFVDCDGRRVVALAGTADPPTES
jgi:hypothetical protein